MCEIAIQIPEEVLLMLHHDKVTMAQYVRLNLAIDLFLHNHVSVGYCAEISRCSEEEFIQELGKRSISIFQFESDDELMRDISNA